jgi:hypothetical protein
MFQVLLLDTLAIATCFLADHGNIAWQAGLTIIASKQDGQGEPVTIAHLLGKDSYDVPCNATKPMLDRSLYHLQESSLLVTGNNVGAENDEDVQEECMLVFRKAFINSYAQPFQKFFMMEPVDQNSKYHNKVVLYFIILQLANATHGISWQNIYHEEVKKELGDGQVVGFSAISTLEMYPIVVLGGGNTKLVACAHGKENMAGAHYNQHSRQSKIDFHLKGGELWKPDSIAAMPRTFQEDILPNVKIKRTLQLAGLHGVKLA